MAPLIHHPAYRARLYDRDGVTVLTPAAGAPHTDSFQVTTLQSLSGYQPYMQLPQGRRGRIDLLSKQTDTGQMVIDLIDRMTGTNAQRWVTAFTGGTDQRARFAGLRLEVEESLDAGATWTAFYAGRVERAELAGLNAIRFSVRDFAEDLERLHVFVSPPHSSVTYAFAGNLLPSTFTTGQQYGLFPAEVPLAASAAELAANSLQFRAVFDLTTEQLERLFPTEGLRSLVDSSTNTSLYDLWSFADRELLRAVIAHTSGAQSGNTGHYRVLGATLQDIPFSPFKGTVINVLCGVLLTPTGAADTGHPNYLPAPANGVTLTVRLVPHGSPSASVPWYIADQHPVQVWKDMLDGKFSLLDSDGATVFSIPYDSSVFSTLIADTSIPTARWIIRGASKANEWIEKHICQPFQLGYRYDGQGRVVPIDLRMPASLAGITTITDTDLAATPEWKHERASRVARVLVNFFWEIYTPGDPRGIVQEEPRSYLAWAPELPELGDRLVTIEATGFRAHIFETVGQESKLRKIITDARRLAEELRSPFATGGIPVTLQCRRTSTVSAWQPGELRLLGISSTPDPQTNVRGGTRLLRCIERVEDGPILRCTCLDLAEGVVATAPTMTTPTQETNNTKHGITLTITLNGAGETAILHTAVTTTAIGTRPAETSALWSYAARITATGSITVRDFPSNRRVWVRARTEPAQDESPKLPSAWAFPAATGFVDTAALTAPSSMGSTSITARSAKLTWTLGETQYPLRVYLEAVLITSLPTGCTEYILYGLTPSTNYDVAVEHFDIPSGAVSAQATHNFDTTATSTVAPDMLGIGIQQGGAGFSSRTDTAGSGFREEATGIEVYVVPGDLTLPVELFRADDNGSGAPDTGTEALEAILSPGETIFRDRLPLDGDRRHYRARHNAAGYTAGTKTDWVAATPIVLLDSGDLSKTDEGNRRIATLYRGDSVLRDTVVHNDGLNPLTFVRGQQRGTARHGDAITFPQPFQNIPAVAIPFGRGIVYEPRSGQWSPSFSSTAPQYVDDAAVNLTASGFTVRARLKQKGTITARTDNFPAGNLLDAVGETTEATTTNAPASDDQYTVHYDVSVSNDDLGSMALIKLTVAIDDFDGSVWTERTTRLYVREGTGTETWAHEDVAVVVTGMTSTEKLRIRAKTFTATGGANGSFTVHGFNAPTDADPHAGVTYNTTGGDDTASRTPDTEDVIEWVAVASA